MTRYHHFEDINGVSPIVTKENSSDSESSSTVETDVRSITSGCVLFLRYNSTKMVTTAGSMEKESLRWCWNDIVSVCMQMLAVVTGKAWRTVQQAGWWQLTWCADRQTNGTNFITVLAFYVELYCSYCTGLSRSFCSKSALLVLLDADWCVCCEQVFKRICMWPS